jgi:hypothetical protein
VALNPEVGQVLSPNFQYITIWDKTNANRRIGLNPCWAVSKELRIDILRLPTRKRKGDSPYSDPFFAKVIEPELVAELFCNLDQLLHSEISA